MRKYRIVPKLLYLLAAMHESKWMGEFNICLLWPFKSFNLDRSLAKYMANARTEGDDWPARFAGIFGKYIGRGGFVSLL